MDARQLHQFLGSKQQFSDWVKHRVADADLVENEDYGVCLINSSSKECGVRGWTRGGSNAKDYWLTLDAAAEFSMLERNPKGTKTRR